MSEKSMSEKSIEEQDSDDYQKPERQRDEIKESKISSLRPNHPGNFASAWGNSDAVFRSEDSDILLHFNRMTLATFSPYFQTCFFSDFMEKDQNEFHMDISYNCLLEILRILHHQGRNFTTTGHTLYSPDMLRELYIAADIKDIPVIRELVKQQLAETKPSEAFKVAFDVNLENEKLMSLNKMTSADVVAFLTNYDESQTASLKDIKAMMARCGVSGLPNNGPGVQNTKVERWAIPENFDRSWGTSNIMLKSKDSDARPLHANLSCLASFSSYFRSFESKFIEEPMQAEDVTIDVDVDHDTLLEILRILHHVKRNFGTRNQQALDVEKLSKLYEAGTCWDMEVFKELCKQQLPEAHPVDASFKVAIDLKLAEERTQIFEKMTMANIEEFLSKNKNVEMKAFSPKEVAEFSWKMKESLNGRIRCPRCDGFGILQDKKSPFAYICNANAAHTFSY